MREVYLVSVLAHTKRKENKAYSFIVIVASEQFEHEINMAVIEALPLEISKVLSMKATKLEDKTLQAIGAILLEKGLL